MNRMELDIDHATQSVELSRRWERLIADLQRSVGDWADADALAQAMDAHASPCTEAPGAESWRVAARFLRALAADRELREIARTKRGTSRRHARGWGAATRGRGGGHRHGRTTCGTCCLHRSTPRRCASTRKQRCEALAGLTLQTLYGRGDEDTMFSRRRRRRKAPRWRLVPLSCA